MSPMLPEPVDLGGLTEAQAAAEWLDGQGHPVQFLLVGLTDGVETPESVGHDGTVTVSYDVTHDLASRCDCEDCRGALLISLRGLADELENEWREAAS